MEDLNKSIFISLFKEACEKCFGFPLTSPLSEVDSKLLSNKILECTGLVIGSKSIKNYSSYAFNYNDNAARKENPSFATLDTLARYVLDAPYTDEIHRKDNESHYPYWFQYRGRFLHTISNRKMPKVNSRIAAVVILVILVAFVGVLVFKPLTRKSTIDSFTDNFNSVSEDSLKAKGWIIKSVDTTWWNRRNEKSGFLSLYTLRGDNWANREYPAGIKNLLMRRINSDCFTVEIHLVKFIPKQNWQQAGILLAEDSTFDEKMLRLSISYNDFFGGYEKSPEIIIQVVTSSEDGNRSKPEEIAHFTLFSIEPGKENLVEGNLSNSVLKIEKKGLHCRFLYSTGPTESFAFKEVVSGNYNIHPRYISIFAIQGWADKLNYIPVHFDSYNFTVIPCSK